MARDYSNRFKRTVTDGLVFEFNPGLAKDRILPGNNADETVPSFLYDETVPTITGTPAWTSANGWAGSGHIDDMYRFEFDGVDDGFDVLNNPNAVVGATGAEEITHETWLYIPSLAEAVLYSWKLYSSWHWDTRSVNFAVYKSSSTKLELIVNGGNGERVGTDVTSMAGKVCHIVFRLTAGDIESSELFVDGVVQTVTNMGSAPNPTGFIFDWTGCSRYHIGKGINNNYFYNWGIGTQRIYNRHLSDTEIYQNYDFGPNNAVEDYIKDDSLVFDFEPALGYYGKAPGISSGSWATYNGFDMVTNTLGPATATFNTTNGWRGIGSENDPYCFLFDGATSGQSLQWTRQEQWQNMGNSITLDTWIKCNPGGASHSGELVNIKSDTLHSSWRLRWIYRQLAFGYGDGTSSYWVQTNTVGGACPLEDEWYHIAVVINGSTARFYVNGEFLEEDPMVSVIAPISVSSQKLILGRYLSNVYQWNGSMAGTRIYNRPFSDAEVARNYRAGKRLHSRHISDPGYVVDESLVIDQNVALHDGNKMKTGSLVSLIGSGNVFLQDLSGTGNAAILSTNATAEVYPSILPKNENTPARIYYANTQNRYWTSTINTAGLNTVPSEGTFETLFRVDQTSSVTTNFYNLMDAYASTRYNFMVRAYGGATPRIQAFFNGGAGEGYMAGGSFTGYPLGEWLHLQLAWSVTNNQCKFLVNGSSSTPGIVIVASGTMGGWTPRAGDFDPKIGIMALEEGSFVFRRLYNRMLSDEELSRNYNASMLLPGHKSTFSG